MLAYLVTKKEDKNLPKPLFIFFILLTAVMILCAVLSVFVPLTMKSGEAEISVWMMAVQGLYNFGQCNFLDLTFNFGKRKKSSLWIKGKELEKIISLYTPVLCAVQCTNGDRQRSSRTA